MANLDDLNYTSISDMQTDEALEVLRQIRISRRIPVRTNKTTTKKIKVAPTLSSIQAAEILKILIGEK